MNSLPKSVNQQRSDCDLNPGPSAPESSTLTTRLWCIYRVCQKTGPETHEHNSLNLKTDLLFFTGRFPSKFAGK